MARESLSAEEIIGLLGGTAARVDALIVNVGTDRLRSESYGGACQPHRQA